MINPLLYQEARERIAKVGFTPVIQSKLALVLSAAKNANRFFLASLHWLPQAGLVQQFIISQSSRELEAVTLLASTTQWDTSPSLVGDAGGLIAPLMMAWAQVMMPPGPAFNPAACYRGFSLGHAQFSRIRLAAVIPDEVDPLAPFVVALQRIEQENGRLLQTQIRLLKNLGTDLPLDDREAAVEQDQALVDGVFSRFLAWLAAP